MFNKKAKKGVRIGLLVEHVRCSGFTTTKNWEIPMRAGISSVLQALALLSGALAQVSFTEMFTTYCPVGFKVDAASVGSAAAPGADHGTYNEIAGMDTCVRCPEGQTSAGGLSPDECHLPITSWTTCTCTHMACKLHSDEHMWSLHIPCFRSAVKMSGIAAAFAAAFA